LNSMGERERASIPGAGEEELAKGGCRSPAEGPTKTWQRALPVAGEGADENLAKAVDARPPATQPLPSLVARSPEVERENGSTGRRIKESWTQQPTDSGAYC
jgi:hypothetical protein